MVARAMNAPLVVIVGQTASGKSSLAMDLAAQFNGEIVAADSRTVYKGMDIGTAKPSTEDQNQIPHHMLDIVSPSDSFTVAEFKQLAQGSIDDILHRNKLPILVGGSGLYVDALIYNFSFLPPGDASRRRELDRMTVEQLQGELVHRGIELPENQRNPRHLIRQLETGGTRPWRNEARPETLVIGLAIDKSEIISRIEKRVDLMMAAGLKCEAEKLWLKYGDDCRALQTIGYKEFNTKFSDYNDDVRGSIISHTVAYAKRQRTWFKRNKSVHWVSQQIEAVDLCTTFLNK